ncbi:MAG: hypothetical protein K2Y21_09310 [Phycisphaerales bacterium]|nr:hypothetical protein [Phycisphaerales bacterium]
MRHPAGLSPLIRSRRGVGLAVAAGSCVALSALAGPQTFTLTGTAPGDTFNFFRAVNFDASRIAASGAPGIGFNGRATLKNFNAAVPPFSLGVAPGATFSDADHITGDGLIVFGRGSTGAWVYALPGPIVTLAGGSLTDISRDGTRKLWNGFVSPGRQVNAGPITLLPNVSPFLSQTRAVAISPDGDQVVGYGRNVIPGGGYGDPDIVQESAAVWNAGTNTWTQLGVLAGEKSRAIRISEDGSVIVGESDANTPSFSLVTRAWVKTGAGPLVDLTAPISEELEGRILDMSDNGSVVLMTVGGVAYLWDAVSGSRRVDEVLEALNHLPRNLSLISYEALSGDGRFVAGDAVTSGGDVIAFAAPIVDSCFVPTGGLPDSAELLVNTGGIVPGLPGPTVGDIQSASSGEGGTVSIQLSAAGNPVLLSGVPGFTLGPICTIGGASPVAGETFGSVGSGTSRFGENAGFMGQLNPSVTQGIFLGSPVGGVSMFARSGDPAPGTPGTYTFSPFGVPLFNNIGETVFFSGLSSGGFLFFSGAPGAVAPVFINPATRAEFPAGAGFTTPTLLGLNDKGQILLTETVSHPSVPPDADEVLMVRIPESNSSWIRFAEGRQAPGRAAGVVFGPLSNGVDTEFDRNGRIAFINTPTDGVTGLFVESDVGLASLLDVGDELPGVPGSTVTFFNGFALDDRRGIVVSLDYSLGGETYRAAWASGTAGENPRLLVKSGDRAPDVYPCGEIDSVSVVASNRNQQTLLRVTLRGNTYGIDDAVLYLHDRHRGLVKIAQNGRAFDGAPGDLRIVNRFSPLSASSSSPSSGRPQWLDHVGNVLTILEYTDGTESVARVRVKPAAFSCPSDFNNDGLVDDLDFQIFAGAYNDLVVPPADGVCDINADGLVDDVDFTIFAPAYDELLCP